MYMQAHGVVKHGGRQKNACVQAWELYEEEEMNICMQGGGDEEGEEAENKAVCTMWDKTKLHKEGGRIELGARTMMKRQ